MPNLNFAGALMFSDRGGVIVYYARHGAGSGTLCFAVKILLHFN